MLCWPVAQAGLPAGSAATTTSWSTCRRGQWSSAHSPRQQEGYGGWGMWDPLYMHVSACLCVYMHTRVCACMHTCMHTQWWGGVFPIILYHPPHLGIHTHPIIPGSPSLEHSLEQGGGARLISWVRGPVWPGVGRPHRHACLILPATG